MFEFIFYYFNDVKILCLIYSSNKYFIKFNDRIIKKI